MQLKEYVDYKYSRFQEKELFVLKDDNKPKNDKGIVVDSTSYIVRNNLARSIRIIYTILNKDIVILERNEF